MEKGQNWPQPSDFAIQLSELKGRSSETASSSTKLPEKLYISTQRTPPRFRWIERLPNWPLFSDLLGLWLQTFSVQSQHNQRARHISMMTFATHKSQLFTWFFLDQNTKYNDFKCTQTTPLLGWQPHPLVLALPHSQGVRFQQQSVPWNQDFALTLFNSYCFPLRAWSILLIST